MAQDCTSEMPVTGSNALQEAHNTILKDILVVSGLIGLSGFIRRYVLVALQQHIQQAPLSCFDPRVTNAAKALYVLPLYVGRQPLFWILLFCTWQVAARSGKPHPNGFSDLAN